MPWSSLLCKEGLIFVWPWPGTHRYGDYRNVKSSSPVSCTNTNPVLKLYEMKGKFLAGPGFEPRISWFLFNGAIIIHPRQASRTMLINSCFGPIIYVRTDNDLRGPKIIGFLIWLGCNNNTKQNTWKQNIRYFFLEILKEV